MKTEIEKLLSALCLTWIAFAGVAAHGGGGGIPITCTTLAKAVVAKKAIETYKLDGNTHMTVGSVQLISEVVQCNTGSGKHERLYSVVSLGDSIPEHGIDLKNSIVRAHVFSSIKFDALKLLVEAKDVHNNLSNEIQIQFSNAASPTAPSITYSKTNENALFWTSGSLREDHVTAELKSLVPVLKCNFLSQSLVIILKADGNKILKDLNLFTTSGVKSVKPAECK